MEIPTEVSDSEINQQSSKISFDCILSSKDIKQTLAETDKMINKFSHVKINKKKDELIDFEDFIAWKEVRPFSSLDFSDGFICYPPMPLSEIPERTVEQYLIKDVLACLVGCNGDYIHVLEQLNKNEDRIFDLSRIPQSLRGLLMEGILPLAVYYSNVVRFIETNQRYAGGRVNQALAAILKELMRDYLCFVSKLEDRQRSGLSTLHELASLVHIQLRSMEFLSNLVKTITATGARGGNTLSILYLECEKSFMDEKLLILLLSKAVLPYFQSLESWIHSGYLFDPYNEFMIVDNKPKHHEKIDEQILSNWLDRYSIKKQRVPKFLESFEEKILRSGKYLNIVKRCQSLIAKEILPVKASLNKQLKFSDPRDSSYLEIINDAYNYSSSALLHLLFRHYHIIDRFRCLKRYFLMEQGDFIVILMDLCEDELNKEMSDVVPTRVLALIEFSLRLCSKGKLDRYKDDITVTFVPYDITYEMCKINAIGTSREKIYQTARHENISGFDSMTLTLNAEWPLSLVFSTKIISVYQILFRLLLKCKRVERELCRVWLGDKRFKSLERVNAAHYTNAFGLRHKMLVFVQSIQYCLMEEIIEYYFVRFMENLKKVKNVDDVLTLHWNFLKSCVDDAIFKYPILTSCIMRTLKTCSEFCDFLQCMRIYCMDAEFTSMLSPDPDTEYGFIRRDKKTERCQQSSSPSFEFKLKEIEEKFNNHVVYLLKIMVNSGKTESSDIRIARCFHKQNYNDYYTRLFHEIETSLEYSSRIRSSYAEEN